METTELPNHGSHILVKEMNVRSKSYPLPWDDWYQLLPGCENFATLGVPDQPAKRFRKKLHELNRHQGQQSLELSNWVRLFLKGIVFLSLVFSLGIK